MCTFAGRVALITGTGSGIGRQFATALAAEGAIIAAYRPQRRRARNSGSRPQGQAVCPRRRRRDRRRRRRRRGAAPGNSAGTDGPAHCQRRTGSGNDGSRLSGGGLRRHHPRELNRRQQQHRRGAARHAQTAARPSGPHLSSLASYHGVPRMGAYSRQQGRRQCAARSPASGAEAVQHRGDDPLPRLDSYADDRHGQHSRLHHADEGGGCRAADDPCTATAAVVLRLPGARFLASPYVALLAAPPSPTGWRRGTCDGSRNNDFRRLRHAASGNPT